MSNSGWSISSEIIVDKNLGSISDFTLANVTIVYLRLIIEFRHLENGGASKHALSATRRRRSLPIHSKLFTDDFATFALIPQVTTAKRFAEAPTFQGRCIIVKSANNYSKICFSKRLLLRSGDALPRSYTYCREIAGFSVAQIQRQKPNSAVAE